MSSYSSSSSRGRRRSVVGVAGTAATTGRAAATTGRAAAAAAARKKSSRVLSRRNVRKHSASSRKETVSRHVRSVEALHDASSERNVDPSVVEVVDDASLFSGVWHQAEDVISVVHITGPCCARCLHHDSLDFCLDKPDHRLSNLLHVDLFDGWCWCRWWLGHS